MKKYLFTSERLGFRNWKDADLPALNALNADPEVMEFFPAPLAQQENKGFMLRMQVQLLEKGYCYFAVDRLDNGAFIGLIGISDKTFEADFTPCVDIGWRIGKAYWGKGYATEGAKRCLKFAFEEIGLTKIVSLCPVINVKSEAVMKRLGMRQVMQFKHAELSKFPHLEDCVLYEISATTFLLGNL